MEKHVYLGDGVYVEDCGYTTALRTNSHKEPVSVWLDDEVMIKLIKFWKLHRPKELWDKIADS